MNSSEAYYFGLKKFQQGDHKAFIVINIDSRDVEKLTKIFNAVSNEDFIKYDMNLLEMSLSTSEHKHRNVFSKNEQYSGPSFLTIYLSAKDKDINYSTVLGNLDNAFKMAGSEENEIPKDGSYKSRVTNPNKEDSKSYVINLTV